jgi:hypothetical protein
MATPVRERQGNAESSIFGWIDFAEEDCRSHICLLPAPKTTGMRLVAAQALKLGHASYNLCLHQGEGNVPLSVETCLTAIPL